MNRTEEQWQYFLSLLAPDELLSMQGRNGLDGFAKAFASAVDRLCKSDDPEARAFARGLLKNPPPEDQV